MYQQTKGTENPPNPYSFSVIYEILKSKSSQTEHLHFTVEAPDAVFGTNLFLEVAPGYNQKHRAASHNMSHMVVCTSIEHEQEQD
ncbi:hypothetical protein QE152_g40601 [Popillia japonica]|uniref:Uncharacterized protein n=1 Tax=Popillia japonica TaxID=7064 RepID=A0AAW1HFR7_POPJA